MAIINITLCIPYCSLTIINKTSRYDSQICVPTIHLYETFSKYVSIHSGNDNSGDSVDNDHNDDNDNSLNKHKALILVNGTILKLSELLIQGGTN